MLTKTNNTMNKYFFSAIFMITMFCGNLSAGNRVTDTTACDNICHFDTSVFREFKQMMYYVWRTAEGLDQRYLDGSYKR